MCPNSEVFPFELIPPVSISPITDNFETYDSYDVTHRSISYITYIAYVPWRLPRPVEIFRSRISRILVPDGWIIEYRLTAGYLYGCGSIRG